MYTVYSEVGDEQISFQLAKYTYIAPSDSSQLTTEDHIKQNYQAKLRQILNYFNLANLIYSIQLG
jgi:hypothetical protein